MTQLASFSAKVPTEDDARVTTANLPSGTVFLGTTPVVRDGAVVVSFKHSEHVVRGFAPVDRSVIIIKDGTVVDEHLVHERNAEFLSTIVDAAGNVFHVFACRNGAFHA